VCSLFFRQCRYARFVRQCQVEKSSGVGAWLLILGHQGCAAHDPVSPLMKYPKRSQYKYAKSRYRARNWAEYEAGLQKRGDPTVWLFEDALDSTPIRNSIVSVASQIPPIESGFHLGNLSEFLGLLLRPYPLDALSPRICNPLHTINK